MLARLTLQLLTWGILYMRVCSSLRLVAHTMRGASDGLKPLAVEIFASTSQSPFPCFCGRLLHPLGGQALHAHSRQGDGRAGLVLCTGARCGALTSQQLGETWTAVSGRLTAPPGRVRLGRNLARRASARCPGEGAAQDVKSLGMCELEMLSELARSL